MEVFLKAIAGYYQRRKNPIKRRKLENRDTFMCFDYMHTLTEAVLKNEKTRF